METKRPRLPGGGRSILLTLCLALIAFGLSHLLTEVIAGQALASGRLAGQFLDSPIERPTATRPAAPPAPMQPMTDPDLIAAYQAKQERPPAPDRQPTPASPLRRSHPTHPPSLGAAASPTRPPQKDEPLDVAMDPLATPTPTPPYVYTMLIGMDDYWHKDYTWKGMGADRDHELSALDVNWWRDWNFGYAVMPAFDDPDWPGLIWAPFQASANPWDRLYRVQDAAWYATDYPCRMWLMYNEMDWPLNCPQGLQGPCYFNTDGGHLCPNPMVHAVMSSTLGYSGPITVTGTPTYEDLHSFNRFRPPVWPPPAPTPSPTPGGPWYLDRNDPCQDLYPEGNPPRPDYLIDTVSRELAMVGGGVQSHDVPVIYDAMARVLAGDYAAFYSTIKAADPTARVFCCGNYHTHHTEWWWSFLYHLKHDHPDVHLDGVHLHTYPWSPATYYDGSGFECDENDQWGLTIDQIWGKCLKDVLHVYMDFHQSVPETKDKPIWISEYGVLSNDKAGSGADVTTGLMQPLAGWIGRSDHRYTGVAWFITYINKEDVADWTHLLKATPLPMRTPTNPLGTTWAAYPVTIYPPTATP